MKSILKLNFRLIALSISAVVILVARPALAEPVPVTVVVTNSLGFVIPEDFSGLSFGAVSELPGHGGVPGLMFNPTNQQLIMLFKNSGLHNLRLGGTTVEGTNNAVPDQTAIDDVFGFAKAAGVKVIYSLPLLNGNSASNAATAQYIWNRYRPQLEYFAIGNEPDVRRYLYPPFGMGTDPAITNYHSFLAVWRSFVKAITDVVPDAKFAGPDSAGKNWTPLFARDERDSGALGLFTQHFYVGGRPFVGDGPEKIPVPAAINHILSANWVDDRYPALAEATLTPVTTNGLAFRLTESDDYLKGIENASDSFATALWGLEYLHWWAAHGCVGVNFHNTEWLKTDTVFFDQTTHSYQINPKAYGIKAFELGSRGAVEPVAISNTEGLNLSAYAVGSEKFISVTVINKEHGNGGRDAAVKILPAGCVFGQAAVMFLSSPNNDAGAMTGMTLGGGTITNNVPWRGKWTALKPAAGGTYTLIVPSASAAIVRFSIAR
jgi:hypothetical protein